MRDERRRGCGRLAVMASVVWLGQFAPGSQLPPIPAAELVRKTVQNEVKASEGESVPHMFTSRKETAHGSQIKLYCETKDAMAGMAISNDGRPLTLEQRQAEEARPQDLMNN